MQITAKHVYLLDGDDVVFDERMPKGVRITKASIRDPCIALLCNDDTCKVARSHAWKGPGSCCGTWSFWLSVCVCVPVCLRGGVCV